MLIFLRTNYAERQLRPDNISCCNCARALAARSETGFLLRCRTNLPAYTYKLLFYFKSRIMPSMVYCVGVQLWEESSIAFVAVSFALRDATLLIMKSSCSKRIVRKRGPNAYCVCSNQNRKATTDVYYFLGRSNYTP